MRISSAMTTLLLLGSVAATASSGTVWMTPFDLLDDGSIVVPVTIGGTGPYRFVLDTGSSRTVIASRVSQALRLPVVAKMMMVTPAGREAGYIVRLNALAIGERTAVSVEAAMAPADRYAAGQRVDGLIGQDILASAVYTIDYQHRVMVWHAPGDALPGDRIPLTVRENRVFVTVAQSGGAAPLTMIPDSGSDAVVLFTHAANRVPQTLLDRGTLSSLSGSTAAQRVEIDGLLIGRSRLVHPRTVVIDSVEPTGTMGDGLLPLHLFSSVTFNVPEGYLLVQSR